MRDGRQWPHSLDLCSRYTLNCVLLKLTLVFLQVRLGNPTRNLDHTRKLPPQSKHVSFLPLILLCILCSSYLLGFHQRMLDGLSLVSIRECSMDAPGIYQKNALMDTSGPIPSSWKYAFWYSCRYATDIGFLAGTPSVAAPRQGRVCALPTVTTSYDSRRVSAWPLLVGSRAAPMVGTLRFWAGAGGGRAAGPIPSPPAGLDDNKHLDIDGCDFGASHAMDLWLAAEE